MKMKKKILSQKYFLLNINRIFEKWLKFSIVNRKQNSIKRQITQRKKSKMLQTFWENYRNEYLTSVKEKNQNVNAIKQYNETLIVKAFVSLKTHGKDHKLKHGKNEKAVAFNTMYVFKKILVAFQQNGIEKKTLSANRFELTKRISSIDKNILLIRCLNGWNQLLMCKKKNKELLAQQIKKNASCLRSKYLQKWIQMFRIKLAKKLQDDNKKEQNALMSTQRKYLANVFNAWRRATNGNLGRLRREKTRKIKTLYIHSVFIAWKLQSKERCLLQQYLKQCNIGEKYTHSNIESYRFEAPKLPKEYFIGPTQISRQSSGKNSEDRYTNKKSNIITYSPISASENIDINAQIRDVTIIKE